MPVQARLGIAYTAITESTSGIAFFGTPHQGSPLASIGDVVAKVVKAVQRNPKNTFMNTLKPDGLYAREISSNFQQLLENYRYLNFCETLPLKSFGPAFALDADHGPICGFASEEDEAYKRVSSLIVELVTSAIDVSGEQSSVRSLKSSGSILVVEEASPKSISVRTQFWDCQPQAYLSESANLSCLI
ncbi:hypothetical protein ETB97_002284 [Aspergillus alliaceus]|uniref:Uncharacterized protein n=1 Tax=Petromyces alliaceus TaxID=209559 RepID=A0A8H6EAU3_PETAA|nr:hypothetical protein ETB97_002284 [Aspergillus burnettii]